MGAEIHFAELTADNAEALSALILKDSPEYSKHFTPFPFDAESLRQRFVSAKKDQYWGIYLGDALAGFCMLRGFDEGYERPSFGLYIAQPFAGKGLGTAALEFAFDWCSQHQVASMMLKVQGENVAARKLYEKAGFAFERIDEKTGQAILTCSIQSKREVYASTACLNGPQPLVERIESYVGAGITNIELGANVTVDGPVSAKKLPKAAHYLIHNYFPPPAKEFVVNLASADAEIRAMSIELACTALKLSAELGASLYSIHAGFITDPVGFENGSFTLPEPKSSEEEKDALQRFVESLQKILPVAESEAVDLIIENNVCLPIHKGKLLLQKAEEFEELFSLLSSDHLGILVDTGHLNVSAQTFNFDRLEFVQRLGNYIRAFHVHDNNGSADQHQPPQKGSWVLEAVTQDDVRNRPLIVEAKFPDVASLAAHVEWLTNMHQ